MYWGTYWWALPVLRPSWLCWGEIICEARRRWIWVHSLSYVHVLEFLYIRDKTCTATSSVIIANGVFIRSVIEFVSKEVDLHSAMRSGYKHFLCIWRRWRSICGRVIREITTRTRSRDCFGDCSWSFGTRKRKMSRTLMMRYKRVWSWNLFRLRLRREGCICNGRLEVSLPRSSDNWRSQLFREIRIWTYLSKIFKWATKQFIEY